MMQAACLCTRAAMFSLLGCFLAVGQAFAEGAVDTDIRQLTAQLHDFLANSGDRDVHAEFWAEDLVYTSSAGLRFGKREILSGFDEPQTDNDEPAVVYSGEDVNVRLFGDMAVVTFRLIGTPSDGSVIKRYYNTGTFLKRDGRWQAVAWQATAIPSN